MDGASDRADMGRVWSLYGAFFNHDVDGMEADYLIDYETS